MRTEPPTGVGRPGSPVFPAQTVFAAADIAPSYRVLLQFQGILDTLGLQANVKKIAISRCGRGFRFMRQADKFRVNVEGSHHTIVFSEQHLNRADTAREVGKLLRNQIERGPAECLNLDLTHVNRLNSAGLNELISINSHCRSLGVRLVLTDVGESVREVFALTRLERMFEFKSTVVGAAAI